MTARVIASVALTVFSLLAPAYAMFMVDMSRVAVISTVSGFVVIFCIVLSLLTEGSPLYVMIGTTTYVSPLSSRLLD